MVQGEVIFFVVFTFSSGINFWPGTLLLRHPRKDVTLLTHKGAAQTVHLCNGTNSCCCQLHMPDDL